MIEPPRRASQNRREKRAASRGNLGGKSSVSNGSSASERCGEREEGEDLLGILETIPNGRNGTQKQVQQIKSRRRRAKSSPTDIIFNNNTHDDIFSVFAPPSDTQPSISLPSGQNKIISAPHSTPRRKPKLKKNKSTRRASHSSLTKLQSPKIQNPLENHHSPITSSTNIVNNTSRSRRRGMSSPPDLWKPPPPTSSPPPLPPPFVTESNGSNSNFYKKIDVLQRMKQGTSMLKYGRFGYPHFRQFQISNDATKLVWFSKNKGLRDTSVMLADIIELIKGQKTDCFKRHAQPQMESLSFSLIYADGHKTLDLCCKTVSDFEIWVQGLTLLIEHAKKQFSITGAEEMKDLLLEIDVSRSTHRERIRSNSHGGGSTLLRGVSRQSLNGELESLKKKMSKLEKFCKKVGPTPQMTQSVDALNTEIESITETIDNDDYAVAKHDIWRLGVEIDTLKSAWQHFLELSRIKS